MHTKILAVLWLLAAGPAFAGFIGPKPPDGQVGWFQDKSGLKTRYVYAPAPSGGGLLVWFHGDGGAAGFAVRVDRLADLGKPYGLGVLAIQAPGAGVWHSDGWPNAGIAHSLISALRQRERLRGPTILAGASGGAVFIGGQLLPAFGRAYKGGAILLCGGAPSLLRGGDQLTLANFGKDPGKRLGLYVRVNRDDYIFKQVGEGTAMYRALGMTVHEEITPKGGHCGFDSTQALRNGLKLLLKK